MRKPSSPALKDLSPTPEMPEPEMPEIAEARTLLGRLASAMRRGR
jgi:hypothetical protein